MPPRTKSGSSSGKLSAIENRIYQAALISPSNVITQDQVSIQFKDVPIEEQLSAINGLLKKNLFNVQRNGDSIQYAATTKNEASMMGKLDENENIVYQQIKESRNEGIWTKQLKGRTGLHQTIITRCLKSLEQKQLVKSVKSVKFPTRKIYMLFGLQPSIELSGGPWYTDNELDTGFINELSQACLNFIKAKSFPKNGTSRALFPSSYTSNLPSANTVHEYLKNAKLTETELEVGHVMALLDILVYDEQLEKIPVIPFATGGSGFSNGAHSKGGESDSDSGSESEGDESGSDSDSEGEDSDSEDSSGSDSGSESGDSSSDEDEDGSDIGSGSGSESGSDSRSGSDSEEDDEEDSKAKRKRKRSSSSSSSSKKRSKRSTSSSSSKSKEKGSSKSKKRSSKSRKRSSSEKEEKWKGKGKRKGKGKDKKKGKSSSKSGNKDGRSRSKSKTKTKKKSRHESSEEESDEEEEMRRRSNGGHSNGVASNGGGGEGIPYVYRAIRPLSVRVGWTEVPCGQCPVFDFCDETGPVNAETCQYFGGKEDELGRKREDGWIDAAIESDQDEDDEEDDGKGREGDNRDGYAQMVGVEE
ncbi:hypothetical protein IE53DRAFT_376567 [Violaceomyces palustris]|uniref:Uncharacterized protein n=1 Tax=Violaceomyces palustris TaxID=1673888 RepID=A0ACD0P8S3_9BASI|nr:hypothetical protein IE53DRAFT_376567 [Violaceomyces palustris]